MLIIRHALDGGVSALQYLYADIYLQEEKPIKRCQPLQNIGTPILWDNTQKEPYGFADK